MSAKALIKRVDPRGWPRWVKWGAAAAAAALGIWWLTRRGPDTFQVGPIEIPRGLWPRALQAFGGRPLDPGPYGENVGGLAAYLQASRVVDPRFPVSEIVTPHHLGTAQALGYDLFVPPKYWWPRTAALTKLSSWISEGSRGDVHMRNHWRPRPYNDAVGGVPDSAHVEAAAVDLDYSSRGDRERAEARAKMLQAQNPWLKMGLIIGSRTLHVDVLSSLEARPIIRCYDGEGNVVRCPEEQERWS